jgi:hypothetical protein
VRLEGSCAICGAWFALTKDHLLARAKGGDDSPSNLRTLCVHCNSIRQTGEHSDDWVLERRLKNLYRDHCWRAWVFNPTLPQPCEALRDLPLYKGAV